MFYRHVNQNFRRKHPNFADKTNHKNSFLLGFFIWGFGFPIDSFVNGKIETPLKLNCVVKVPVYETQNSFRAMFSFSTLSHDEPYHPLDTIAFQCIRFFFQDFVLFLSGKKWRYRLSTHILIFVVNIRPARTFWNSTHCLLSPFTLDWSRNLLHNPIWNMADSNISYPIYPFSTRTEKGYITKMIPFFFFVQYNTTQHMEILNHSCTFNNRPTICFLWLREIFWLWHTLD